jgi:hypothetical protein
MTYRADMPPAEKAAAMEAWAKREAEVYKQTTLPLMLRDGAAAVREVERLRLENAAMARVLNRATGFTGGRDDAGLQRAIQGERERHLDAALQRLEDRMNAFKPSNP